MVGNVPLRGGLVGPLLVLPCPASLAVFAYRPVVRSGQLSMFGSDPLGRPRRFVGLDHCRALIGDPAPQATTQKFTDHRKQAGP